MNQHSTELHRFRFYGRAFALATVAGMAYLLWLVLSPFVASALWAAVLAFMVHPVYRFLLARWRRPNLTSGLVTASSVVIIGLPAGFFVNVFVRQANELLVRFRDEAHTRNLPALRLVLESRPVRSLLEGVESVTSLSEDEVLTRLADGAQEALQLLASLSGSLVLRAFNVVATFLLTMFLLFFFVRDGAAVLRQVLRLVPLSPHRMDALRHHLGEVTRAVVVGTTVTALVQGTLLGIGFAVAGLPSPVVFGSVAAFASLIPVVGTGLVWVPAVLALFATGANGWGVFLLLWCGVLVVGSDNVIRPLIISGQTNLSTPLIILGVMGGVGAFGMNGLFVGPLVLTLAAALLRYASEDLSADLNLGKEGAPSVREARPEGSSLTSSASGIRAAPAPVGSAPPSTARAEGAPGTEGSPGQGSRHE